MQISIATTCGYILLNSVLSNLVSFSSFSTSICSTSLIMVHEIYGLIKRSIIIRCFDSFFRFLLLHNINNINNFTWNKVTHDMRPSNNLKTISMVTGHCSGIKWEYSESIGDIICSECNGELDFSLPLNCRRHFLLHLSSDI